MSVLEQIRKLDEQKAALLSQAKAEALTAATVAIADLNELGFNYRLVQGDDTTTRTPRAPREGGGTRRTGIRDDILAAIQQSDGMARADLLKHFNAETKSDQQAISNAVAALKKNGIIAATNGVYSVP